MYVKTVLDQQQPIKLESSSFVCLIVSSFFAVVLEQKRNPEVKIVKLILKNWTGDLNVVDDTLHYTPL